MARPTEAICSQRPTRLFGFLLRRGAFFWGGGALQGFGNGFIFENGGWLGREDRRMLFGWSLVWLDDTSRVMRRCGRDVASRSPDGLRLLGNASLGTHNGRVWFGWTIALSWLWQDAWRGRCKFIDMDTYRDGGVARNVGAAGQATLGVRWRGDVTATERR